MVKLKAFLSLAVASILALTACGGGSETTFAGQSDEAQFAATSVPVEGFVARFNPEQGARPTATPTSSRMQLPGSSSARTTPTPQPTTSTRTQAQRHVEEAGGFSYVVPSGWQLEDSSRSELKQLVNRRDSAIVRFEVFELDVSLEVFKEVLISELENQPGTDLTLVEEKTLTTDAGAEVLKLVTDARIDNQRLRLVVYLVDFGSRKVAVNYARLRNAGQRNDAVVDALVKSIEPVGDVGTGERHVEPAGGFSYVPPEGWELVDTPGLDYKTLTKQSGVGIVLTTEEDLAVSESLRRSLRREMSSFLSKYDIDMRGVRIVEDKLYTTESGYPALRFALNGTINQRSARLFIYLVQLEQNTVIAFYVRPQNAFADEDAAVEAMINTLVPANAADKSTGSTTKAERYFERSGNFSYEVPAGWQMKQPSEIPDLDIQFAGIFGPASQGFAPNVLFSEDGFSGSFASYVRSALRSLRDDSVYRSVSDAEEFKTDSGIAGVWVTAERMGETQRLRQAFYIFPERSRVVIVVYTRLSQGQQSRFDEVVEAMMRSFRFGR